MDIEIVVVGESSKWVLNQSRIRIGQDPNCEVSLPAGKYPAVSGEHVVLEAANGALRLSKGNRSAGETYVNGHPADSGVIVRSGDVLRLGAGGPELRIRLLERETYAQPAVHEPTRVMYDPAPSAHEPTRVMHEPTRVVSGPAATTYSPPPPPPPGAGARPAYPTQTAYGGSTGAYVPAVPAAATRRPDAPAIAVPPQLPYAPPRGQQPPAQAVAAQPADGQSLRILERKLKSIRLLLLANLALAALLCVWVFLQGQELSETHKELQVMHAQTQSAVGQFTPALDARLKTFDDRMAGMDAKMMAAQDRLVKGMDAEAKVAEDHMVQRMNVEIPAMLDKFVAKTVAGMKH
ncbi:MAG: FHA domain-containing protein [Terracidiphilus sp.]|jgi:pSer/pThr/pTyr-binding forkhead associated (FHA) protein